MTPEAQARVRIDELLTLAGWSVQDAKAADLYAALGVALRELPMKAGHGKADYVLYVDQRAIGVIEAKPVGYPLASPVTVPYRIGRLGALAVHEILNGKKTACQDS